MKTYIIIHGTKGSPEGNWFPWLASELRQTGALVFTPRMPTPENQSLSAWLAAFLTQCGPPDHTSTIIGHSIGATFLLRLLEQSLTPILHSVLVAGVLDRIDIPEFDNLNRSFTAAERPFDWPTIRRNAGKITYIYGEADPYVPESQSLTLAHHLGVTPTLIAKGKHLNSESGYTSFPQLLDYLINHSAYHPRPL
jgi:predicted alpha/beta hydrolase family esterase